MDYDMNRTHLLVFFIVIGLFGSDGSAQQRPSTVYAGWVGVFPEVQYYQRVFDKPSVNKQTYRQTARYEWMGGRAEVVHITLMRDAGEAKRYTPDGVKALPELPMPVKIGERDGYRWKNERLVIVLKDNRLVKLEAPTYKQHASDLVGIAKKLDLDACEKALEQPPRTDFTRDLKAFQAIQKGMSHADVSAWVGESNLDIGSGIHILVYPLADGSRVLIGFPDFNRLVYVKHVDKAGKVVELAK
jgi:hypothetical protein